MARFFISVFIWLNYYEGSDMTTFADRVTLYAIAEKAAMAASR